MGTVASSQQIKSTQQKQQQQQPLQPQTTTTERPVNLNAEQQQVEKVTFNEHDKFDLLVLGLRTEDKSYLYK